MTPSLSWMYVQETSVLCANGLRYRQGRELAEKATRRRIRRWGRFPESAGSAPHLSGARGVSPLL